MGSFDKAAYDREYHKNNTCQIYFRVMKSEGELFDEYCESIGETRSELFRRLVNEDAISNGFGQIFSEDRKAKLRRRKTDY